MSKRFLSQKELSIKDPRSSKGAPIVYGRDLVKRISESQVIEHDIERCGLCFKLSLDVKAMKVALDMLPEPADILNEALKISQKQWEASKFHQLWHSELGSGRDLSLAFRALAWEPEFGEE